MTGIQQLPPRPATAADSADYAAERLRVGFQVIGFDWRYIFLNPAAAAHGRRRPEDLEGRSMMEMYPGIEQTPIFKALRRCMSERSPVVIESLFTFPDGQTRWFEVRAEPSSEGINVFSFDIQERKVAQLAREAERASFAEMPFLRRMWVAIFGTPRELADDVEWWSDLR